MKPIPLKEPDVHLTPPPNWDEELDGPCGTLDAYQTVDHGYVSFWRPCAEELEALKRGAPVRLGVHSRAHPAVSIGVIDDLDPEYTWFLNNFIEEKETQ